MIAVIDYGMGNLRSVQKALQKVGAEAVITNEAEVIEKAAHVVLPGVGAMKPAMDKLLELKLIDPMTQFIEKGNPFLGICLGHQLLFETSDEGGNVRGLGWLKGCVKRFWKNKVPHMGWNQIAVKQKDCPLFSGIPDGSNVYFCHSYYAAPAEGSLTAAETDYGVTFASAVSQGNLYGVQFHPEKSQDVGLKILENFVKSS